MSTHFSRTLSMLVQIPTAPNSITAKQLHTRLTNAGYDITLRSVQRDLNKLSVDFPLVQLEENQRELSWAFMPSAKRTSFPVMDSVSALTLTMAMNYLKTLLPPEVLDYLAPWQKEADDKLSSEYKDWLNKVRVVNPRIFNAPTFSAEAVEAIYKALLENKQIEATYNGQKGRIIHPYGLVQQGHVLYLICRFYEFDDVRLTALHRFNKVTVLDENVRAFPTFNIDDYLDQGVMQWLISKEPLQIKLAVNAGLTKILQESMLSDDQFIEFNTDGTAILDATVADSEELRRWILSQGTNLKVLAPQSLKNWAAETIQAMYEQTRDDTR